MRYLFAFIILIHGLIHLMGFAKAYDFAEIKQLTLPISKPVGILWLLSCLFFLGAGVSYLAQKDNWWMMTIPAVLLSQVIIVMSWQDARYGTLVNTIILIVAITGYINWKFDNLFKSEVKKIFSAEKTISPIIVTKEMLEGLPEPVQNWLMKSGVIGKEMIRTAYLRQKGEMRLKPGGEWIPFEAEQFNTLKEPAFIWKTRISPSPFMFINGKDRFVKGNGNMLIKAYGLINVSDAKGPETDLGSMLRYLGEIIWFPTAAISPNIQWEPLDSLSAKVKMTYTGKTVSGIYHFTPAGEVAGFEAMRFYDRGKEKATLEKWTPVNIPGAIKKFDGIKIPYKSEVIWRLDEGDFVWFRLELTEVYYNKNIPGLK